MLKQRGFRIKTLSGKTLKILPLSLTQRESFREILNELQELLQSLPQEQSFISCYDSHELFKQLVNEALQCHNLNPEHLDIDTVYALLMPYEDADGTQFANGALIDLNFNSNRQLEGSGSNNGGGLTYTEFIASLWGALDNLDQAIKVAQELPADVLLDIIKYRGEQAADAKLTDREKYERKMQGLAREDIAQNGLVLPPMSQLTEADVDLSSFQ